MSKLVFLFLIMAILAVSGCVHTYAGTDQAESLEEAHVAAEEPDPCENVTCPPSTRTCPDGAEASCTNTCSDGKCTSCTPDCGGHESSDPCEGVVCPPTTETCPDGSTKSCDNECVDGECTYCDPGCPEEECNESWSCTDWSSCSGGTQTRTCTDSNSCGTTEDKPVESQSCSTDHVIFSEVYYDVDGDDSSGEWIELYNPGSNVNITGWTITDNTKTFTIPDAELMQADGYFMLARNSSYMESELGCSGAIDMSLGLNNAGDYLILKDSEGNEADFVAWEGGDGSYEAWDITAHSGEVIRRKDLDDPDTDSVNDWEVEDDPDPDC